MEHLTRILFNHKRLLYSKIENKLEEWRRLELGFHEEEERWNTAKTRQQQSEYDREEEDKLAAEQFLKEMEEIVKIKRHKTVVARRFARKMKNISRAHTGRNVRRRRSREGKTDRELIKELKAQHTPEQLKKWLYRNLSLIFFPRNTSDPYWKEKDKLIREIIANKDDLSQLKKIAIRYKPEWIPYLDNRYT